VIPHRLKLANFVHDGKKELKPSQPSLNRCRGSKLDLIKSLRVYLDQNRVEGPKLDFHKT
jgi:hypothetical protein